MENVKFVLPLNDVGRILQVLTKHPYEQVADLIERIKVQVESQLPHAAPAGMVNGSAEAHPDA